jgi:hypothetical protein
MRRRAALVIFFRWTDFMIDDSNLCSMLFHCCCGMHIEMECPYHLFTFEIMPMIIMMWPKLPDESELNHLMSHSIMEDGSIKYH